MLGKWYTAQGLFVWSNALKSPYFKKYLVVYIAISAMIPQLLFAQTAAVPPQPTTAGTLVRMGVMFVMVYAIFHLLVIKPQKTKLSEQQKLLSSLKRGEQVVTSSGIVAKVANVEKEHVLLELAPNVRVKFEVAHIVKRLDKPVASA